MLRAAKYLLGSPGANGFGSKSTAEDVCPDLGCITAIITGAYVAVCSAGRADRSPVLA
jgi:retinol dehydrogenase-12